MSLVYMTSQNSIFDLETDSLRMMERNALRGYGFEREYVETTRGERLRRFTRGAVVYSAALLHYGRRSARYELMNELEDAAAWDRDHKTPGRLVYTHNGVEEYIPCYVIGADVSDSNGRRWDAIVYQFYCPCPYWVTERTVKVSAIEAASSGGSGKDYPNAYPYGYSISRNLSARVSGGTIKGDSAFRLVAHGATSGVRIHISGNTYEVDYPVPADSDLILDTREETESDHRIYVRHPNGDTVNVFAWRGENALARIPAGQVTVSYRRTYPLTLTIYSERSEPRWN